MRLQKSLRTTVAFAALAISSQQALAAAPDLRISGFGTLGYVTTNTNDAEFRSSVRQHKGATKSDGDWGVDSRLGLQANVTFNDMFSAVGQLYVARRDGDSSPNAEWLFIQADVTDSLSLRAGRMVMPTFLLSDFRHVGYAQHWIRTPGAVYGGFNTTFFDGAQAIFRHQLAGYNLTAQVSGGSTRDERFYGLGIEGKEESDKLYSANLVAERGNWLGRVSHTVKRDTRVSFMGLVLGRGDDNFSSVGMQYDDGSLLVMSEYVWRRWTVRNNIGGKFDSEAFYVSAGYRFGPVMPYATYSQNEPQGSGYSNGRDTQKARAVGARWDVVRNLAFKAQFEETSGGVGSQFIATPSFQASQPKTRIYSVALDFVF